MATAAPAPSPPSPGTAHAPKPTPPESSVIVVGKDVLELLSSAMYVDPLSIYREYIQNAADAIDDARSAGLLASNDGQVDIRIDADRRAVRIRDNGLGIAAAEAPRRLLAIGASAKRGTPARGFRGVGRLAGLAYARSLVFRTRSRADEEVAEIRWDCQRLKAALRDVEERDDITSVIQRVVTIAMLPADGWPQHFFEVELNDVVRTRRDDLLSPALVRDYLEEVAPVPFNDGFGWAEQVQQRLASVRMGNLRISINDEERPITRPFRDSFMVSSTVEDRTVEIELVELSDLDGGTAAVGWIAHHNYLGSITTRSRVGGLRLRVGNVQVGGRDLLASVFPEPRFNGWAVGELHVLDPRIVPNARRDNFEQNIHFSNMTAQLEPITRRIARRARTASICRNRERREHQSADRCDSKASTTLNQYQKAFLTEVRAVASAHGLSHVEVRAALREF